MSRDSFVFYSSFALAANTLGDKARLKLYDSVVKLGLCCAENETELNQVCADIESSLIQNRNVFAQFLLIKPQIISNFKKFINGSKGKEYGALGGAPKGNKNATKNNPKTTPNVNVNDNVNDNVNVNIKIKEKSKNDFSDEFEQWWVKYPNKKSKQDALKVFSKILSTKKATFEELMNGLNAYNDDCKAKNTEAHYIKHPSTWLNQGCWADEYNTVKKNRWSANDEDNAKWEALFAKGEN